MFFEVSLQWETPDGKSFNVLHYDLTEFSGTQLGECTAAIASLFSTHAAQEVCSTVALAAVIYRPDTPGSIPITSDITGGGIPGTASTGLLANHLAMLIRKRSNTGQRPNIGHLYMPGITANKLGGDGRWAGATRANLDNFWTGMMSFTYGATGQAQMYIKASDASKPNTVAYNPVTDILTSGIPTSLNSRRPGRGV